MLGFVSCLGDTMPPICIASRLEGSMHDRGHVNIEWKKGLREKVEWLLGGRRLVAISFAILLAANDM